MLETCLLYTSNAAAASGAAFDEVRRVIERSGAAGEGKGPIVLATVEGDIHDIGKNIVKTVLENYGFHVIDLGRDVPADRVVEAVKQYGAKVVGLSALMTTTVPSMETVSYTHLDVYKRQSMSRASRMPRWRLKRLATCLPNW